VAIDNMISKFWAYFHCACAEMGQKTDPAVGDLDIPKDNTIQYNTKMISIAP